MSKAIIIRPGRIREIQPGVHLVMGWGFDPVDGPMPCGDDLVLGWTVDELIDCLKHPEEYVGVDVNELD